MALAVEFGEMDLERHECGEPWTPFGGKSAIGAALRWGWPAYEAFSTASDRGWIHPSLLVCIPCDCATIWAPGSAQNKRLARLLRYLQEHVALVERDELEKKLRDSATR